MFGASTSQKIKKQWISVAARTDFSIFMSYHCFKQFKQFVPKIWENTNSRDEGDLWWCFSSAMKTFNNIRSHYILTSEIIPVDETMSAFRPQTTKTGSMPNISLIFRKPDNLGTEFKTVVCPFIGAMNYMEIQSGKERLSQRVANCNNPKKFPESSTATRGNPSSSTGKIPIIIEDSVN